MNPNSEKNAEIKKNVNSQVKKNNPHHIKPALFDHSMFEQGDTGISSSEESNKDPIQLQFILENLTADNLSPEELSVENLSPGRLEKNSSELATDERPTTIDARNSSTTGFLPQVQRDPIESSLRDSFESLDQSPFDNFDNEQEPLVKVLSRGHSESTGEIASQKDLHLAHRYSSFHMVDVGDKKITKRYAKARGSIYLSQLSLAMIQNKKNPKGDVFAMAEIAGMIAAKDTSKLLPLCHPLQIDKVQITFEMGVNQIDVICEVYCHGKTGVEMEALTGATTALLTIYDLAKAVDPVIEIGSVFLDTKKGGKSGVWQHPKLSTPSQAENHLDSIVYVSTSENREQAKDLIRTRRQASPTHLFDNDRKNIEYPSTSAENLRISGSNQEDFKHQNTLKKKRDLDFEHVEVGLITMSDRASQGLYPDHSGPVLSEYFQAMGARIRRKALLPDCEFQLKEELELMIQSGIKLIAITGGTGLSPRDITPEVLESMATKKWYGFGEAQRVAGSKHTDFAWASRCAAYICLNTLVVLFPGKPKAVKEGLVATVHLIKHALDLLSDGNHGSQ